MRRIISLLVTLFIVTSFAHASEKRVLVEGYTGSWCGWCPNGAYIMDELYKAHPGKVIGVKYHLKNGGSTSSDGMQIPEGAAMFSAFKGGSVPSGSLDRYPWTKGILINPAYWPDSTNILLAKSPAVDVALTWYYNATTKKITGKITCTALQNIDMQLAFQVIVCEDSVTGTGSQFDQNNSLSGNDKYKHTPYYDQPSLIIGYVHNRVARAVIGGNAGNLGNFPASVKEGEIFKWDFEADLPSVYAGNPVDINKVSLIGLVGLSNTAGYVIPVLNCIESASSGAGRTLAVDGEAVNYTGSGTPATFKFILDNSSKEDKTYNLTIEKDSLTPEGWLAQVVGGKKSLTIKADGKASVSINVFPNDNIGNGNYKLVATDKDDENSKLKASVEVVHTGAERLYVYYSKEDYSNLRSLIHQTTYGKFGSLSTFTIGEDVTKVQALLAKFTKVKTIVFSMADIYAFTAADIALLQAYYNAGLNLLIDGTLSLSQSEIQTFLKINYGFSWSKQYKVLNKDQQMSLDGVTGEYITNGLACALKKDKQWPSVFSIIDASKSQPILVYKEANTEFAAVESNNKGKKLIAFGFALGNMTQDQQKIDLLEKSLYWLENEVAALKPVIASEAEELDFGSVEQKANKDSTLKISNLGTADLTIEGMNVSGNDPAAFNVAELTFPKTLKANQSLYLAIQFYPTEEKHYWAKLNIQSNDSEKPELTVDLIGNGIPSSVKTNSGFMCGILLSPNPVTNYSEVTYTTTGMVYSSIRIIDAQGRVVYEIYNGLLNAGTYNYSLNGTGLPSGNYFITAQFDDKSETLPFVIVK